VLVWLPILLYYITDKGFTILLVWLFIAPMTLNFIHHPNRNPFFTPELELDYGDQLLLEKAKQQAKHSGLQKAYTVEKASIRMDELLVPTRFLFLVFVLVLLMDKYYKKIPLEPFNKTETLMMVFTLLLVVNAFLWSHRVANSLKLVTDAFFIPYIAYYVARRFVTSEERLRQLTNVLIAFGLMLIFIAIVERIGHSQLLYRLRGPFPHRNQFYMVMMVVFFMTLLSTIRSYRDRSKALTLLTVCCWVILCVTPMVIVATWTRSNWLGFVAALWVSLFFARRSIARSSKVAIIGLVLLLIPVLVIGLQAAVHTEAVDGRIANESTVYSRIGAWLVQLEAGMKNPLLGIGFNNVRELLLTHRIYFMGVRSLVSSHNCFLAIFVELGSLGLFVYLAIAFSIIRAAARQVHRAVRWEDGWLGIVSAAILVGCLVPGLTSVILYSPSVSHVYVYTCLGALAGVAGTTRVAVT
jgi:O-antigen ligase